MITFSSRCGSESRREPKREGVVPYRNRSNVGPTIAHPAPAAILIRHELRPNIWGINAKTDGFRRLVRAGLGYSRTRFPARNSAAETGATLFPAAESVATGWSSFAGQTGATSWIFK